MKTRLKTTLGAATLVLTTSLIACGKNSGKAPAQPLPQAQENALHGKISCPRGDECPEGVALLVSSMADTSVESCTSFLIGPDLLMTSSACIAQELQSAGSSCSNRIWAHFAETPSIAGESVGCEQVVSADAGSAVLRLSRPVLRQALEISQDGLLNRDAVKVAKINPVRTSPPEGELQLIECRVAQNSLLRADILDDCVAVPGNGGAPVLDSNGRVRAVIERAAGESDRIALSRILDQQKLALLQGRLNPIAFAHSLATPAAPSRTPVARTSIEPRILQELRLKVREWARSQPKLQWQAKLLSSGEALTRLNTRFGETERSIAYGIAIAKCWERPASWLDEYRRVVRYRSEGTLQMQLPIWPVRIGVNATAQPDFQLTGRTRNLEARLEFNPRSIQDTGKSPALLIVRDSASGEIRIQNEEIGACQ